MEKATKEKIFEAAVDLFSQKGFSGVSVREITKQVGIKESSLYNHFSSKDEILETIFDFFKAELNKTSFSEENMDELVDTLSPEEFFRQSFTRFAQNLSPTLVKIWRIVFMEQFRERRARDFILHEMIYRPVNFYEKAFVRMVEKKLIKELNPRSLAEEYNATLLALSIEFNILKYDDQDTTAVVGRMFEHIKFFMQLVRADEG